MKTTFLQKPTPKQLALYFRRTTGLEIPREHQTYKNNTPVPIRPVAEYEEMGGVVLSYVGTVQPDENHKQLPPSGERTFGIPDDLIIKMQQLDDKDAEPVHIFILCAEEKEKETIIDRLQKRAEEENLSFDRELLHLIPWDSDTYWTRDFSPWWVKYTKIEEEIYAISKHIYTSLGGGSVGMIEGAEELDPREGSGIFRCNDDYGAVKISDFFNAPIRKWNKENEENGNQKEPIIPHRWFFSGLLNVGGNYMATSQGVIASSYLVATQNELPTDYNPEVPDAKAFDNRMNYIMEQTNRFLGANTYHVFTDPTETYIGHIDCWGKFLSDTTVLIAKSKNEKIDSGLDKIAEYFKEKGFHVYRVICQDICVTVEGKEQKTTAAFTNSLILNKHVYVPLSGEEIYDRAALNVYQTALGDAYTIHGIYGKKETPWLGTDALHCRTNTIPRAIVNNRHKRQSNKSSQQ